MGTLEPVETDLRAVNLDRAILTGVDLRKANLERGHLSEARLEMANLTGANLEEGDLSRANFKGANLTGANLRGASLERADFLYQEQIERAEGDTSTSLPQHLQAPSSWNEDAGRTEGN